MPDSAEENRIRAAGRPTVHRGPVELDTRNLNPHTKHLVGTCDGCGSAANVSLTEFHNSKYVPGPTLCWNCSDSYGPFDSDRAALEAGREPFLVPETQPPTPLRGVQQLTNRELAAALRAFNREPSGEAWVAGRLLRSAGRLITEAALVEAEALTRQVVDDEPGLTHAEAEGRALDLLTGATDSDAASSLFLEGDGRRYWFFVVRDEVLADFTLAEGRESAITCSRDTRQGDLALLYRGRPASSIVALLEVTSDARAAEGPDARGRNWQFFCDYRVVRVLDEGVHISELREEPDLEDLGALRRNFQASAVPIEDQHWPVLLEILHRRDPQLATHVSALSAGSTPRRIFRSERDMEDYLEEHLELFRPFGYDLERADLDTHGVGHRQHRFSGTGRADLICVDRNSGRIVIIELKNAFAKPEHVGQLCNYIGWFLSTFPYLEGTSPDVPREVEGILVTRGESVPVAQALQAVPYCSHISVDDLILGPAPFGSRDEEFEAFAASLRDLAQAAQTLSIRLEEGGLLEDADRAETVLGVAAESFDQRFDALVSARERIMRDVQGSDHGQHR